MLAVSVAKLAVGLATQVGAGTLIGSIAKSFTPENLSTAKKICVTTATIAAGGLVGSKLNQYTDETIDEIEASVRKITGKPAPEADNK